MEGIKAAVSIVAKKDAEQDDTQADGRVRTPQAIYLELDREVDRIISELKKLHADGKLESLADESQVFADHLKDAAKEIGWEGKDPSKTIAWERVKRAENWRSLVEAFEGLDLADRPVGFDPTATPESLLPTYECADALLRMLQVLQAENESEVTNLLKTLAPQKGKQSKRGAKVSLADRLKLTADRPVSAADIALFGRMTTSEAFQDVEAACQVADAISTHPVDIEDDFFTAKDDLDTGSGAAYASRVPARYASAVFYKYLSVDHDALLRNLGAHVPGGKENDEALKHAAAEAPDIAARTIEGLLRAIMHNVPSGKINSHAHNQQPSLILVELKPQRLATNYLTAFHDPARAGEREDGSVETLLTDSVRKLVAFARYRDRKMPVEGTDRYLFAFDEPTEDAIHRLRESLADDEFFSNSSLTTPETFEGFVAAVNKGVREGRAK